MPPKLAGADSRYAPELPRTARPISLPSVYTHYVHVRLCVTMRRCSRLAHTLRTVVGPQHSVTLSFCCVLAAFVALPLPSSPFSLSLSLSLRDGVAGTADSTMLNVYACASWHIIEVSWSSTQERQSVRNATAVYRGWLNLERLREVGAVASLQRVRVRIPTIQAVRDPT